MSILTTKDRLHQLNMLEKYCNPSLGTKISLKTEMATGLFLGRCIVRVTILHSLNVP
jgi:hypothetical protein